LLIGVSISTEQLPGAAVDIPGHGGVGVALDDFDDGGTGDRAGMARPLKFQLWVSRKPKESHWELV
jgi:hypothetical protein